MGMPYWEVDDGLVLLYILGRNDMELLGVTNTFGNGTLKDVIKYTKKQLEDIGRTDIPRFDGEAYHGQNPNLVPLLVRGINRYKDEIEQPEEISPAAVFLADTVAKYPGEVTILAAGPLSNLYKASLKNPSFFSQVKEIVCMGGVLEDFYIGTHQLEELNFACDPEAAHTVLHSEASVTIMNAHVCLQAPFGEEDINRLDFWPKQRIELLENWLQGFSKYIGGNVFYLWDLLLPVYVSYPELFERKMVKVQSTRKDLERGFIVLGENEGSEVNMPMHITDTEAFINILFDGWRREAELESSNWDR